MAKVRPTEDETHIKTLQNLCEQAEKLSHAAAALCKQLAERMEATRAAVHLERRRKPRKDR